MRIKLPLPKLDYSRRFIEEVIAARRSIREYTREPLSLQELSQLLWAAQGITSPFRRGFRAAPSAGATYPLELYVVAGEGGVEGLEAGVYHYNPYKHSLELVKKGDFRRDLQAASLHQECVGEAPIDIVITAEYERTTSVYGERGIRYVIMEVGHVGQNIYLEATALGLGTVAVGAFYDEEVRRVIGAPEHHKLLYIMPVGRPRVSYKVDQELIWRAIEEGE